MFIIVQSWYGISYAAAASYTVEVHSNCYDFTQGGPNTIQLYDWISVIENW